MRAFGWFLLGILVTFAVLFGGGWLYLKYGHPPVAVSDAPFPMEAQIVHVPMRARVARDMQQPPFTGSEEVYDAGAKIYTQQCARCHGAPGHDADIAKWMYPTAPQLWKKHHKGKSLASVMIRQVRPTGRLRMEFGSPACLPSNIS